MGNHLRVNDTILDSFHKCCLSKSHLKSWLISKINQISTWSCMRSIKMFKNQYKMEKERLWMEIFSKIRNLAKSKKIVKIYLERFLTATYQIELFLPKTHQEQILWIWKVEFMPLRWKNTQQYLDLPFIHFPKRFKSHFL